MKSFTDDLLKRFLPDLSYGKLWKVLEILWKFIVYPSWNNIFIFLYFFKNMNYTKQLLTAHFSELSRL